MSDTTLPLPPAQPPGEEGEDAWESEWLGSFSPHTLGCIMPTNRTAGQASQGRGIAEDCLALFPGPSSRSWEDAS